MRQCGSYNPFNWLTEFHFHSIRNQMNGMIIKQINSIHSSITSSINSQFAAVSEWNWMICLKWWEWKERNQIKWRKEWDIAKAITHNQWLHEFLSSFKHSFVCGMKRSEWMKRNINFASIPPSSFILHFRNESKLIVSQ